MRALNLLLGVVWISMVCGGVIKDQEDLSLEAAVAGNKLDEHTAVLTEDELQTVALLERIQTRFGTLDNADKAQFVKKISTRQDKFSSTLNKVETIPGMYNLDVPYLRANLGIPYPDETKEGMNHLKEEVPAATVVDTPSSEATISSEDESPFERSASANPYVSSVEDSEPVKTLDDVYEVMTILKQLMMVKIVQQQKQEEEEQIMSYAGMFYNPPRSVRPSYHLPRRGKQSRVSPPGHVQQAAHGQGYPGFTNLINSPESDGFISLNKRHRRSVDAEENEDDDMSEIADTVQDDKGLDVAQEYENWYGAWFNDYYKEWYGQEVKDATANFWEANEEESSTDDDSSSYALFPGMGDLVEPMQDGMEEMQKLLEPLNDELMNLLEPLDEQLREFGRYHGLDLSEGSD